MIGYNSTKCDMTHAFLVASARAYLYAGEFSKQEFSRRLEVGR